jgi:hypothetical protein
MATNILVLGGGELGMAMLTALSKRAPPTTKLTVMLRPSTISSPSPSKSTEIASLRTLNIGLLPGDIATSSIPTLASLFKPYDLIISCLGFATGPGSQLKIAHAVLEAGIKRYFPWQFGVDYEVIGRGSAQTLWDEQLDVRDLLRTQKGRAEEKTEWVIVSTGMFTSFLFEAYFGVVDFNDGHGGVVRALGGWENQVTVTTPEDIGMLTSEIVFVEPRIVDRVVFTAGETISYGKLAELVEEVTGRDARREVWSTQQLKEELKDDPDNAIKKYRVVFSEGTGVSWDLEKTFNKQRGIETSDVRSWALKYVFKDSTSI